MDGGNYMPIREAQPGAKAKEHSGVPQRGVAPERGCTREGLRAPKVGGRKSGPP
jgi:hypothetical protein